jgi:hypothetical protein
VAEGAGFEPAVRVPPSVKPIQQSKNNVRGHT